ncbi:TrkA C-terminal domain-containing protein [Candidatus Hydrogenedentota bacterium]
MLAVFFVIVVLLLSVAVVRVGGVALELTGLSRESARFQALSAFSGAGFTTTESESVIQHPVRRRIIAVLLRLGNAGIITVIASIVLSFAGIDDPGEKATRLALLMAAVLSFWLMARSSWIDRRMSEVISWALGRWTDLQIQDFANILRLSKDYSVIEFFVDGDNCLRERSLSEVRLSQAGINVLGIYRDSGEYIGCPTGTTRIQEKDKLVLYGQKDAFQTLTSHCEGFPV